MRVLLGCDGGGRLGVGHVMRALALADAAVAAGHEVVVAGHFQGPFLGRQLAAARVEVAQIAALAGGDPHSLIDLAGGLHPDLLHVDSYGAPRRLAELVASAGVGAVVSNMEDGTFGRRPADVAIDPTLGAEGSARPDDGSTWVLRGSRYTPVRQRVRDARARAEGEHAEPAGSGEAGGAASVLVVMGGTDPMGLAPVVVGLLARTGLALDVTAIAVGENAQRVRAAAAGSAVSVRVLAPVDDLASMMSGRELVISAAGTSVWEVCCVGLPMAVVWVVDNQREGYDQVVAAGAALGLGGPELGRGQDGAAERAVGLLSGALTDSRARADLAEAGRRVVDGMGAWRVVETWEQARRLAPGRGGPARQRSSGAGALVARRATAQDARLLWLWHNDPLTLAGSRSPEEVTWHDHLRWLTASLARTDRMMLVVEDPLGPVGTVRWDLHPEGDREWEVSITVAPRRRGQSLARRLLGAAEVALSEATRSSGTGVLAYLAVVHRDNRASQRLFQTSAYVPDLPPDPAGFMRFRKAARVP
jgi:spore coat polysaccharide biosynthesis predicted glycosyltransferase SpsG/ribosomal protein S18 acetylase RimI-like enzyme